MEFWARPTFLFILLLTLNDQNNKLTIEFGWVSVVPNTNLTNYHLLPNTTKFWISFGYNFYFTILWPKLFGHDLLLYRLLWIFLSEKPKKPSIFISSETSERVEVTCSEEDDLPDLSLTLYIDGSAVASSQSSDVRGVLYRYYLEYRDSFLAECFVSLNHINFTTSARRRFPANYSSPVAKPFTSDGAGFYCYAKVIITFCVLLSFINI